MRNLKNMKRNLSKTTRSPPYSISIIIPRNYTKIVLIFEKILKTLELQFLDYSKNLDYSFTNQGSIILSGSIFFMDNR